MNIMVKNNSYSWIRDCKMPIPPIGLKLSWPGSKKSSRKRLLLLISFIAIMLSGNIKAQQILTAAGDLYLRHGYSVAWTLGEPATETLKLNKTMLTQGFLQPYTSFLSVNETGRPEIMIRVYPNPARDFITVRVIGDHQQPLMYDLFDSQGSLVEKKHLQGTDTQIDLSNLSASFYGLRIRSEYGSSKLFLIHKMK